MSRVSSKALCTSKHIRRLDLILSVLTKNKTKHTHSKLEIKNKRKFLDVWYLDCGDGITGVCMCPNTSRCMQLFVYQWYSNKSKKLQISGSQWDWRTDRKLVSRRDEDGGEAGPLVTSEEGGSGPKTALARGSADHR